MHCKDTMRSRAFSARGIAALWAMLALAAGGGASAAPTETVLYSFTGGSEGDGPVAGLIADSSGNLYGTTTSGGASGHGHDGCSSSRRAGPRRCYTPSAVCLAAATAVVSSPA